MTPFYDRSGMVVERILGYLFISYIMAILYI